jgi:enoyl-CoA hydratase
MKSNIIQIVLITLLISINSFEYIKYTEEDEISLITISRPKALNALNSQVLNELSQVLDSIDKSKISALIITGEGEKSFVAGADISEMSSLSKKEAVEFSKKGNDVFRKIETFEIPVIAAINGYALGGGCELSLSCDIRICSENAIFGQPEVGLGITPGFGGTQRLSRTVGIGMAKQMIFTGQNIKAEEALKIGLVNAVYPQNELINEAKKLALSIAKNSKNAVKLSKKAINDGLQVDIDKAINIEEKLFGECFENPDQKERMKKFLERGKKKEKKNLRSDEEKKEEKKEEELPLPKGELVPTDKFKKMTFLKEFTTPQMPAILSAGDKNHYNSMAIEWGSIGVSWKMPIFTVYVKDERYTYEFMQKTEYFTVSIINKKLFKKFANIYGTKSGRDINKEEAAGTHIQFLDDGGITFKEAEEVFVCRMLGKAFIQDEDSYPGLKSFYERQKKYFKTMKPHGIFIGEIIGHYIRKSI